MKQLKGKSATQPSLWSVFKQMLINITQKQPYAAYRIALIEKSKQGEHLVTVQITGKGTVFKMLSR